MTVRRIILGCALALGLGTPACGDNGTDSGLQGRVEIGAVLPFSGDLAATGSNVERVLLLLTENVNRAGGVAGKEVDLVATDSHSDNIRGLAAAQSLIDDDVIGVVGPESEDLAKLLHPLLDAKDTILVSPGISSPSINSLNDRGLWFRIGPSTALFSQRLAERIFDDGITTLAVLYADDEYGAGFASLLINDFENLGGEVTEAQILLLGAKSYTDATRTALDSGATACALLTYPKPGSAVISEAALMGEVSKWYFAPPLRSQVFLENVTATSVSGTGVSSALDQSSKDFVTAFSKRWHGDVPLHESFAYYDGLALLLLAYQATVAAGIAAPKGPDIHAHMIEVSRAPGTVIHWNELDRGLDLAARGEPVDYHGVSGSVDLSDEGDTPDATVRLWVTKGGIIYDQ